MQSSPSELFGLNSTLSAHPAIRFLTEQRFLIHDRRIGMLG
jgi:hypothetical protein